MRSGVRRDKTQDQVLLSVRVREHIESIHPSSQPLVQKEDSDEVSGQTISRLYQIYCHLVTV